MGKCLDGLNVKAILENIQDTEKSEDTKKKEERNFSLEHNAANCAIHFTKYKLISSTIG